MKDRLEPEMVEDVELGFVALSYGRLAVYRVKRDGQWDQWRRWTKITSAEYLDQYDEAAA
jgi:hypothetical protein